jgi:hypothetical protein
MGYGLRASREEALETNRRREIYDGQKRVAAKRMALAEKIAMMVVDKINAEIVRPGPKPEERECYVMAQEMLDFEAEVGDFDL